MALAISEESRRLLVSKLNALALGLDLNRKEAICGQLWSVIQGRYGRAELTWEQKNAEQIAVTLWLPSQFRAWHMFSGDPIFPVPAPADFIAERSSLSRACLAHSRLPRWEDEYGAARKYLASHLMYHLENEQLCPIPSKA